MSGFGVALGRRPAVRLAHNDDAAGVCDVHAQHERLEAAFSEPELKPYPAVVRLAILVGAPVALWAGVFWAAALVG
ncbi:MAG: hypothetical protein JO157_12920, partial [Acetobacteraceae bacterium]|nr:hypothetical protein [Acetobacteraceae bacterium]